jgi:hypothetical protein
MCDSKNAQLLGSNLIDYAVGEATEDISLTGASEYNTEQGIAQNEIYRSFKFSHKCKSKLGKRCRSNNGFHFSDARPVQVRQQRE